MAYFAEIDSSNIVTRVLVVRNEDCLDENGQDNEAIGVAFLNKHIGQANWIKTSYNTRANTHFNPDTGEPDNKNPFRGNYAGVGFIYDTINDVFYPPRPVDRNNISCDSWTINAQTNWVWTPPVPRPTITKPINII